MEVPVPTAVISVPEGLNQFKFPPQTPGVTCVKQEPDDVEVGVGDAVMERHVPVAVGEVDDVAQQRRGELGKGLQVLGHLAGPGGLLAGHPEPFPQDQAAAGQLGDQAGQRSRRKPLASTPPTSQEVSASEAPFAPTDGEGTSWVRRLLPARVGQFGGQHELSPQKWESRLN